VQLTILESTAHSVRAGYDCPCGCHPSVTYAPHDAAAYDACCCGNEFVVGAEISPPRGPLPDPRTPAPVRLLPVWDATLLVHARRTQILPEWYRPLVFNTKTPHSVATFLVDGTVAGTWRYERGRVLLHPFERLSATARRDLEAEAQRLAAFHAE